MTSSASEGVIDDALLTAADVAALLNLGRTSTYQLFAKGQLTHFRIGRLVRVREADLPTPKWDTCPCLPHAKNAWEAYQAVRDQIFHAFIAIGAGALVAGFLADVMAPLMVAALAA